jgi:hypothetical protein
MFSRVVSICVLLFVWGSLWAQAQTERGSASMSEKQTQGAQANSSSAGKEEKNKGQGSSRTKDLSIESVTPGSAAPGDAIEIKGSSFGEQGKVTIGEQEASVSSWTDDQILAVIPNGLQPGKPGIGIEPKGKSKQTFDGKLEVKAASYDKTSFELLTGVGASFLPVESTSYKLDSTTNALSQTNVARKHIELLVGGAFILPWGTIYKKQGESDKDYKSFHPVETFLSLRFAPGADQAFTGFVVGGGWRVQKYFSLYTRLLRLTNPRPDFGVQLHRWSPRIRRSTRTTSTTRMT